MVISMIIILCGIYLYLFRHYSYIYIFSSVCLYTVKSVVVCCRCYRGYFAFIFLFGLYFVYGKCLITEEEMVPVWDSRMQSVLQWEGLGYKSILLIYDKTNIKPDVQIRDAIELLDKLCLAGNRRYTQRMKDRIEVCGHDHLCFENENECSA